MNAPLRRVAVTVMVLIGLLFLNLNYVQFVKADDYRTDPLNSRVRISEYNQKRGSIVVDGQAIADSLDTGKEYRYQRRYPAGRLYSAVTGYTSMVYGNGGTESAENPVLTGDSDKLFVRRISDLVTGREPSGGNVVLSIRRQVQQTAYEQLGDRKGAVVALDPRTGGLLAMVSSPTYDPNEIANNDTDVSKAAWKKYNTDQGKPMLNRALNESYPPGSTFKVVTSAAALSNGYSMNSRIPAPKQYKAPQTNRFIQNFEGETCASDPTTLLDALRVSCNTSYAQLGVTMGAEKLRTAASAFGFDRDTSNDAFRNAPTTVGPLNDPPAIAQSSIGQRDVRQTPLQGALVAGAVANGGVMMAPSLVSEIQGPDLAPIQKNTPKTLSTATSPGVAQQLQQMMKSVVDDGTGTAAKVSGAEVGGKTGTAEMGEGRPDTTWFIGWAKVNGQPVAAVAVALEESGGSSKVPTSIGGQVLRSAVQLQGAR